MKQIALSIEQMQHLKESGCDTSEASMVRILKDNDGNILAWDEVEKMDKRCQIDSIQEYMYLDEESDTWRGAYQELLVAETGDYDHSYKEDCGCFTVHDIIEILSQPLDCYWDESEVYHSSEVVIYANGNVCIRDMEDEENDDIEFRNKHCLIDKLYDCLVWLLKNKYIKENGNDQTFY